MKIVIVATFFERPYQLAKTIKSLESSKHTNFELIVVDDNSKEDINIGVNSFPITIIKNRNKQWTNPEPAYNLGIAEALKKGAEIIILQNAENYHVGDILTESERVTLETYISFGCYSLNEEETFRDHDIREIIRANDKGAVDNGQNAWYNHPCHRPVGYDFCSAITAENLRKLNGYDERFSDGYAYGDDNLLDRIKKLGLKIEITEYPFVVHQWHYSRPQLPNQQQLVDRNLELFKRLSQESEIKAQHIYTPNL